MNYRLSSEAPFPAAIQDVKAAIKFVRAHADEYSVDQSKGVVRGGSAGGHLAALAALTCGVKELEPELPPNPSPDAVRVSEQSDCMQGAVTWYGVFDLSMVPSLNGSNAPSPTIRKFLNCADTCLAATLEAASQFITLRRNLRHSCWCTDQPTRPSIPCNPRISRKSWNARAHMPSCL